MAKNFHRVRMKWGRFSCVLVREGEKKKELWKILRGSGPVGADLCIVLMFVTLCILWELVSLHNKVARRIYCRMPGCHNV